MGEGRRGVEKIVRVYGRRFRKEAFSKELEEGAGPTLFRRKSGMVGATQLSKAVVPVIGPREDAQGEEEGAGSLLGGWWGWGAGGSPLATSSFVERSSPPSAEV